MPLQNASSLSDHSLFRLAASNTSSLVSELIGISIHDCHRFSTTFCELIWWSATQLQGTLQNMDATMILAERLQVLPSELFNKIYNAAFAIDATTCNVTSDYKPPTLLQVDKASREAYAETYYSNIRFDFTSCELCCKWLASLSLNHHKLLTKIRLIRSNLHETFEDDLKGTKESPFASEGQFIRELKVMIANDFMNEMFFMILSKKIEIDFDILQFRFDLAFTGRPDLLLDIHGHGE